MKPALFKLLRIVLSLTAIAIVMVAVSAAVLWNRLPDLILSRGLPQLSKQLNGFVRAGGAALDFPLGHLQLRDVRLEDAGQRTVATAKELTLTLDFASLSAKRRLVLGISLSEADLDLRRDSHGTWNLAEMLPSPDGSAGGGPLPVTIALLDIRNGRFAVHDEAAPESRDFAITHIDAQLRDLQFDRTGESPLRITAKGSHGEALSMDGSVSLKPLKITGHGAVDKLSLPIWSRQLGSPLAGELSAGQLEATADWSLRLDPAISLDLNHGELRIEDLRIAAGGPEGWNLQGERFEGSGIQWTSGGALSVDRVTAENVSGGINSGDSDPLRLHVRKVAANGLRISGDGGEATVQSVHLEDAGLRSGRNAARVDIREVHGDLAHHQIQIGGIAGTGGQLQVARRSDGRLELDGMVVPPQSRVSNNMTAESSTPWVARVQSIYLTDYAVDFHDAAVQPPVAAKISGALLSLGEFRSDSADFPIPFALAADLESGGLIRVSGKAFLNPLFLDVEVDLEHVALADLQAYGGLSSRLRMQQGFLDLSGAVSYWQAAIPTLQYDGDVELSAWVLADPRRNRELIRWGSLRFDGLTFDSTARRVSVRQVKADEPFAQAVVAPDGRLNLIRVLTSPSAAATPQEDKDSAPWSVVAGTVRITRGRMDFSDRRLRPGFTADIRDLYGRIQGISSLPDARAEVVLDGRINHSATVNLSGQVNPFRFKKFADIAMHFRGLNLAHLSPYASRFAGHRIEKGKVDLDLRYRLKDGLLSAQNRMVLDQLVLGERVESPTATNLPVRLAVALLKDSAGRIDLDLPVTGNLDAPEVSLGSLLSTAVTQLVAKVAGSPFSLLASLGESGPEDLGRVEFAPGDAALSPEQGMKLAKIAAVLKKRPELTLDIKPSADAARDRQVLAERALAAEVLAAVEPERRAAAQSSTTGQILANPLFREGLAAVYAKARPNSPEARALAAAVEQPAMQALFESAKDKLIGERTISENELRRLAQERGESIRRYLVQDAGVPDRRIYLLDAKLAGDGEVELGASLSLGGG